MADGKFLIGKPLGGVTTVSMTDGASNTNLVLPESGTVASVSAAVTDNAISRYDGTTGKLQNSGVIIDDNGNIGIGVTPNTISAGYKTLQINGSAGLSLMSSGNDTHLSTNAYYNSGYKYQTSGVAALDYSQADGTHTWRTAPSGTAGNPITWTTAMALNNSSSLLTYGSVLCGYNGSSFKPSGETAFTAYGGDGSNYVQIIGRNTSGGNSTTIECFSNGARRAAILDNGTFLSATGSYAQSSDIKLKENINDASQKLDKLMQVKVKTFNYKGQEDKQIGVIAQEIEQIFPSLVFETKDTEQVEVSKERTIPAIVEVKDAEGNIIQEAKPEVIEKYIEIETQETGEVTKNVKYSIIYMMMLKGMQEMRAEYTSEIEALKSRIEILEGAK